MITLVRGILERWVESWFTAGCSSLSMTFLKKGLYIVYTTFLILGQTVDKAQYVKKDITWQKYVRQESLFYRTSAPVGKFANVISGLI
jgi:hypothetical protein